MRQFSLVLPMSFSMSFVGDGPRGRSCWMRFIDCAVPMVRQLAQQYSIESLPLSTTSTIGMAAGALGMRITIGRRVRLLLRNCDRNGDCQGGGHLGDALSSQICQRFL